MPRQPMSRMASIASAAVILAVGLSIFAFGLAVHRYGKLWADRFVRRPPPTLSP